VKSLQQTPEQETPEPDNHEEDIMTEPVKAEISMDEIKSMITAALADVIESQKPVEEPKPKGGVQVIEDEADRNLKMNPFKPTDFFKAVYKAEVYGETDQRLLPLKATGLNEAIPSQGGFLVQQDIAQGILDNMWGIGSVLSVFNPINVSGNGLKLRAVDETSRAAGSRMGGVTGYWLAEAAQVSSSKPTFRTINLDLNKVAALVYATDELLADATAMESWIVNNVPNELRFLVEDSIIDGDGVGKPLGILQSGALVSATRTDASEIDAADIARMWAARYPGVNDYVWFANSAIMPQIYQLQVGNVPVFQSGLAGYTNAPYGTIFGRPVIENEYCPYLGTVGDLLLASPSQYALITKGGIQAASSIHVKFDYDETAFRFIYRVDGQPVWASAVTAFDGTASISPFVALAATT
jgi:HK97 family phage major capsid protein